MKATEQYFLGVLFIMLYKVVPSFEPVDKVYMFRVHGRNPKNPQMKAIEQYFPVRLIIYYAAQGGPSF